MPSIAMKTVEVKELVEGVARRRKDGWEKTLRSKNRSSQLAKNLGKIDVERFVAATMAVSQNRLRAKLALIIEDT